MSALSTNKKRARGPTVAMRVSAEEKAALERAAGNMSLNAYLRGRVLGDSGASALPPSRSHGKKPLEDREALGRVLAALGRSGIPDALERLIAAQQGRPSGLFNARAADNAATHAALLRACADIAAIRIDLLRALGLKPQDDTATA